jgi:excinuclease ABC subunit C
LSVSENVAGLVVCDNGQFNRAEYRHFKIKTVEGADDFASLHEAVLRRYRRLRAENGTLPDLILIDGGLGQLNAAAAALQMLDLAALPLACIVKPPKRHNEVSHLLVRGREHAPVYFDARAPALRLVQQIRDETHRVAVTYHRKRRELRDFSSELLEIPGVGEKRKQKLLRNFGSLVRVAQASLEELRPFVGAKTAQDIVAHFQKQKVLSMNKQPTKL